MRDAGEGMSGVLTRQVRGAGGTSGCADAAAWLPSLENVRCRRTFMGKSYSSIESVRVKCIRDIFCIGIDDTGNEHVVQGPNIT